MEHPGGGMAEIQVFADTALSLSGDRTPSLRIAVRLDHVRKDILPVSDAHTRRMAQQVNEPVGLDGR